MTISKTNRKNQWSISMLQAYESCHFKYKKKYIEYIPDKPGPAAKRGLEIHAKAEQYLNKNIRGLPPELFKLKREYQQLRKAEPLCELKLAVDVDWKPVSYKQGWGRGIVDALARAGHELVTIDHKTGRMYPDKHKEAAEVYACLVDATIEESVDNYHVEFWYIDQGQILDWDFTPDEVAELREQYTERAMTMLTATRFPKMPSKSACQWCPASSKKGGTCHEWKKI